MIRRIEALNFRCLRYISQDLDGFQVLVGPNASGKTTFLDVVAFLGDLVTGDVERAIGERTSNFQDLVWKHSTSFFELAVEVDIPAALSKALSRPSFSQIRYEVRVGSESENGEVVILAEKVLLKEPRKTRSRQQLLFPSEPIPPDTILSRKQSRTARTIANKVVGGNDNYHAETGSGWEHVFKLGPRRSTLRNLPEDESKFPVSTWLKRILLNAVQKLILNSHTIRLPSPPRQPLRFCPQGSNLPWVINDLVRSSPERFRDWLRHLQTALPDLENVTTIERPEDKHRYIVLEYANGTRIPSWTASDGTLRLLALTIPAYLNEFQGIFLIEEPENGIHPRAVDTLFQSLSSVYETQFLVATHSPVILSIARPEQVLCFAKSPEGATNIVRGNKHPALTAWKGETNLGELFAGGVLG